MPKDHPRLAVLAGGAGTRLGGPKSSLVLRGMPILEWIIRRLSWPSPTLLVTAPSNTRPPASELLDGEVVDPVDGGGPLQGVITAMRSVASSFIIIPVDMPMLARKQLLELGDLLMSGQALGVLCRRRIGQRKLIEPFPCAFKAEALEDLERHLRSGQRSLRSLMDAGICDGFDADHWPESCWVNMNTPADLARFESSDIS